MSMELISMKKHEIEINKHETKIHNMKLKAVVSIIFRLFIVMNYNIFLIKF